MQNAAFAAAGLDWQYHAVEVEARDLAAALAALQADHVGANVTVPHKEAAARLADEAEGDSVNTLLFRAGCVLGFNTDKEIVAGIPSRRVCLIGAGGAAKALLPGLQGEVRVFSRGGAWPPDASGCDLIVNATPVREEVLVEPRPGQTVVELAYFGDGRETALVAAARAAGCEVVDGYEALVRQGAASFRLWTGLEPPVHAMRSALGLAT
jgi:shikimate dehydrogenase